jgi:hypothetical protein
MENDEAANAHAKTKLTAAEVKLIRASNGTHRDLAALFGVSNVTIHCIRQRKTWKHVE